MATRAETFAEHDTEVRELADHRDMDLAHDAAKQLVRDFPEMALAHFRLNYVICVGNKGGGARFASPDVIARAGRCTDLPPDQITLIVGDMKRDRAIGLIRFAFDYVELQMAEEVIAALRKKEHADDPNRLAVLFDVEGRLAYARRCYTDAVKLHEKAHQGWMDMTSGADPVWIYNNKVHWLKAIVAAHGRKAAMAKWLVEDIRRGCPGSRNRGIEATVIMMPVVGNWLHDQATRRR